MCGGVAGEGMQGRERERETQRDRETERERERGQALDVTLEMLCRPCGSLVAPASCC